MCAGLYGGVKMQVNKENGDGIESWQEVTLVYNAALKQVQTKMEILNQEFQHVHQSNPIEHIKARIKSPESIVKKLTIKIMIRLKKSQINIWE